MAETKRPYDPVKRREYYLRTRELKGRSRRSKNSMLTDEDRSAIKKHEKLSKEGKTSKKLDKLEIKLMEIEKAQRQLIVDIIQGNIAGDAAVQRKKDLDSAHLKVRDQIWNEKNNLKAKKIGKDALDIFLKAERNLREKVLSPTAPGRSYNEKLKNKDWLKKYEK